jgi:sigma-B regulation protein RsbU (phosphoserine phosphatase)
MIRWSINVLLVDDDPADTSLTLNALLRHKDVATAHAMDDPIAALRLLETGSLRPDLILLDINMPKMDGFGFIERLRRIPAMRDTPVTFLTTSRHIRDIVAARDCGSHSYVVKPDNLADLRARLDLEIRRAKASAGADR